MNAYVANGGGFKLEPPAERGAKVTAAENRPRNPGTTSSVVQSCPKSGNAAGANANASKAPEYVPPATPCPCKITSLTVTCNHGRSAKSQLLQIVAADLASGDPVTAQPGGSGDCASKLLVRSSNLDGPSESYGTKSVKGSLPSPSAQPGSWGWWKATPSRGSIEATACSGNPQLVNIERFPSGESKVQLNVTNLLESWSSGLRSLPVDLRLFTAQGNPRNKKRRGGEAKAEDFTLEGLKKRFNKNYKEPQFDPETVLKIASAWKEEEGSNLVYCEIAAFLGADPLFDGGFSILIYGVPIPPKVRKYINVAAGIYLNVTGKIVAGGEVGGRRYPAPRNQWNWSHIKGGISGEIKLELALELAVLSPKVLQAKGAGAASASTSGHLRNDFGPKIMFEYTLNVGKLVTTVTFKTLWGLVEYEREWPIFEGFQVPSKPLELVDLS